MDISTVMTTIAAHATASVATFTPASQWDVAVAPPLPRGKTVRIFYAGERETPHFGRGRTLRTQMIGQAVAVRAFWPVADYAKDRRKNLMVEMAAFAFQMRTRVHGDSQLGGNSIDLTSSLADPDDILFGQVHYATLDIEYVVEADEFTLAP